jgi:hypothetical protein
MVLDSGGPLGHRIELHDSAAKKRSGRTIPLHQELRRALLVLRRKTGAASPGRCRRYKPVFGRLRLVELM